MAEFVKKRFVHLTHSASGHTLFANAETYEETTGYYTLTGSTAEDAEFVTFSGNDLQGYTIIPTTAVVFVDFPDGTTGIISHLKFYSKLDELGGGATPSFVGIRVLPYENFPTSPNEDLGVNIGDVCAVRTMYSGTQCTDFAIAVCTGAASYEDSGTMRYSYSWQEVYRWPNSMGWANTTTPLGS
jgi:hypothetical protein